MPTVQELAYFALGVVTGILAVAIMRRQPGPQRGQAPWPPGAPPHVASASGSDLDADMPPVAPRSAGTRILDLVLVVVGVMLILILLPLFVSCTILYRLVT